MGYLALAALGLIAVMLLVRLFVAADPARLAGGLKWAAIGVAGAAAVGMVVTGRLSLVAGLAALLVPAWMRWNAARNRDKAARGPGPGGRSAIRTDWLEAELDHASGALAGRILRGARTGQRLEALDRAGLTALLAEIGGSDPASCRLVEALLDRRYADWRAAPARAAPGMDRAEALRVLGLEEGADEAAIVAAHRRLMLANHPDRGGSAYLAAQINEAKQVLLRDGAG